MGFFLLPEDDVFAVVAFFTYHNTLFPACSRPHPKINRFEILQNNFYHCIGFYACVWFL